MVANTSTNPGSDTQDFDPLGWRSDSVCRQHPTQWWFAGGTQETLLAKNICSGCTVKAPCLEFALSRPDLLGIWAGTTPTERVNLRRQKRTTLEPVDTDSAPAPTPSSPPVSGVAVPEPRVTPAPRPLMTTTPATTPASEPEPKRRGAYGPRPTTTRDLGPAFAERGVRTDRDELLTPAEAAHFLGVTPNTVTRWSRAGKISAIQTMGGHRRFRRSEIERVLRDANLVSPRADLTSTFQP